MLKKKRLAVFMLGAGISALVGLESYRPWNAPAVAAGIADQASPAEALGTSLEGQPTGSEIEIAPPDYVVRPEDTVEIDVLKALSNHPIHGGRIVQETGIITLQHYGNLEVAGLTAIQIKEKLVQHLRRYLSEEALGLRKLRDGKPVMIAPRDTERVTVEIQVTSNKYYTVAGDVPKPGRFSMTGNESVRDAILSAGVLLDSPETKKIRIIRSVPSGIESIQVDPATLAKPKEASSKYWLLHGDKVVVESKPTPAIPRKRSRQEIESRIDIIIRQLNELKIELAEGEPRP